MSEEIKKDNELNPEVLENVTGGGMFTPNDNGTIVTEKITDDPGKKIVCPKCGSSNLSYKGGTTFKCYICSTEFTV
jgi:tRNA(Ile2) C34 agmatinyltransferase TiaS